MPKVVQREQSETLARVKTLFSALPDLGLTPNSRTYSLVIEACVACSDLSAGRGYLSLARASLTSAHRKRGHVFRARFCAGWAGVIDRPQASEASSVNAAQHIRNICLGAPRLCETAT